MKLHECSCIESSTSANFSSSIGIKRNSPIWCLKYYKFRRNIMCLIVRRCFQLFNVILLLLDIYTKCKYYLKTYKTLFILHNNSVVFHHTTSHLRL